MAYPLGQPTTPATTSATKPAKSSAKTKKKSSAFDGLSSFDIFALLRQKKMNDGEETAIANSEGEEDNQESKASSEASVTNNDHNSFFLVKNMTDKVILGIPFINSLYPFLSEHDGITIDLFGQKVKFKFASRFEIDTDAYLNLIHAKTKHLNFLK